MQTFIRRTKFESPIILDDNYVSKNFFVSCFRLKTPGELAGATWALAQIVGDAATMIPTQKVVSHFENSAACSARNLVTQGPTACRIWSLARVLSACRSSLREKEVGSKHVWSALDIANVLHSMANCRIRDDELLELLNNDEQLDIRMSFLKELIDM